MTEQANAGDSRARDMDGTAESLAAATGAADTNLPAGLVRDVVEALAMSPGLDEAGRNARIAAACAMLREIAPRDPLEGILAAHMAGVHGAAMACLQRAVHPGASPEVQEAALKQATRLLALFPRQLEVLERRRQSARQRFAAAPVTLDGEGRRRAAADEDEPQIVVRSIFRTGLWSDEEYA